MSHRAPARPRDVRFWGGFEFGGYVIWVLGGSECGFGFGLSLAIQVIGFLGFEVHVQVFDCVGILDRVFKL